MITGRRVSSVVDSRIGDFSNLVYRRKRHEFRPFPIILGAGASLTSGASSMKEIVTRVAGRYDLRRFYSVLDQLDETSRVALLWDCLNVVTPSIGYTALVWLLRRGYFDVVFTTNHDTLLENSLAQNGLLYGQDFVVGIIGRDTEDAMVSLLRGVGPRIKVIKLHGCISIRKCAFTPKEIIEFQPAVERLISDHLVHGALIVGHSMRDVDLNRCFSRHSGNIWYVAPRRPGPTDPMSHILDSIPSTILSGSLATFDNFFSRVRDHIVALETRP